MPFLLKAQRHVVKKSKRSRNLNTILPPGELVDVASIKGRSRDLLQAPSVSTIILPGGTEFAINMSKSDMVSANLDHTGSGEYNSGQFLVPLEDYSIDSDEEDQSRKYRNRTQARRSKANVATRWSEEVLPRILPIYVKHQACRFRGRTDESDHENLNEPCGCQSRMRLNITVLRWNCACIHLSQEWFMSNDLQSARKNHPQHVQLQPCY
jgi:hypothetical protein